MKSLAILLATCWACVGADFGNLFTDPTVASWGGAPVAGGSSWTNVTRGLTNQWLFLEGTGTTTTDAVDSATGTLSGTYAWRNDGGVSSIGMIKATDTKIQLSTNTGAGSGAMSVSVWVCASNAVPAAGSLVMDMVVAIADGFNFYLSDSTHLGLDLGSSGLDAKREAVLATALPTNGWVHLSATWNGTMNPATGIHIYTNGVEDSNYSTTVNGTATHAASTGTTRNINGQGSQNSSGIAGGYSDVRVYNVELSPTEISHLYNYGRQ